MMIFNNKKATKKELNIHTTQLYSISQIIYEPVLSPEKQEASKEQSVKHEGNLFKNIIIILNVWRVQKNYLIRIKMGTR